MKSIKDYFLHKSKANRFYAIAIASVVLTVVWSKIQGEQDTFSIILMWLSGLSFGLGFIFWVSPWIRKAWESQIGKVVISLGHAFVLFLSIVPARLTTARALGLPPQDFDYTVGLLAILFYPVVWVLVGVTILMLAAFAFLLMHSLTVFAGLMQLDRLLGWIVRLVRLDNTKEYNASKASEEQLNHGFGLIAIVLIVSFGMTYLEKSIPRLDPAVRWVAYIADYQELNRFPKILKGDRVLLHANGFVSVASRESWDIRIDISKLY